MRKCLLVVCGLLCVSATLPVEANERLAEALKTVRGVTQFGEGQPAAVSAIKVIEQAGADDILPILAAMDGANPLAANWLRGAFESAADRLLKDRKLAARDLETFVNERAHEPRVRRLAYEWLIKADPDAEQRLIPGMLDDPSPEMRRDAVAKVMVEAEHFVANDDQAGAKAAWNKALTGAVDTDQFDAIAAALEKLGEPVDRVQHFGLLLDWHVIGPFDNREMKGFDVAYPPEEKVDLQARYEGLKGEVKWEKLTSDDKEGKFDIAKLTAPHKGSIDYLYSEFASTGEQEVEFRLGTPNAWKLWLNGELLFAREEYHRGMQFDQYAVRGKLKPGANTLLLKVCQNEMEQDWAQDWVVQFRVCDLTGRAVHPASRESAFRE